MNDDERNAVRFWSYQTDKRYVSQLLMEDGMKLDRSQLRCDDSTADVEKATQVVQRAIQSAGTVKP